MLSSCQLVIQIFACVPCRTPSINDTPYHIYHEPPTPDQTTENQNTGASSRALSTVENCPSSASTACGKAGAIFGRSRRFRFHLSRSISHLNLQQLRGKESITHGLPHLGEPSEANRRWNPFFSPSSVSRHFTDISLCRRPVPVGQRADNGMDVPLP